MRDAGVVAGILNGTVLLERPKRAFRRLTGHAGPVVWQTADYEPLWYSAVAVLRSLRGRRTTAICYRNNHAADGKYLRRALRDFLFRMWNILPFCNALTTCPDPAGRRSSTYLYDIEWWDLTAAPLPEMPLPQFAGSGKILMFLGSASHLKGVEFFIDSAVAAAAQKSPWRFVLVGTADAMPMEKRELLLGAAGILVPGPRDDAAFIACMRAADMLWCCYHPIYDQSSGIFGRSLQLNKPAVVRAGSLLDEFQSAYGQGIAVAYGDTAGLLAKLEHSVPPRDLTAEVAAMYSNASIRLRTACGIAVAPEAGS